MEKKAVSLSAAGPFLSASISLWKQWACVTLYARLWKGKYESGIMTATTTATRKKQEKKTL